MSLIKKPSELVVPTTLKSLLYGQPGIGKTTLALSSPDPLLLDFDGGVHRVQAQHQTPTVQIRSWEDVQQVLQEDLTDFKTLVIDTAGKMLDFMSTYLIKTNPKMGTAGGQLQIQGYGARKAMFIQFLTQVSMLGLNLIFVAHDTEEKDGEQKIIRPLIGGSSGGDLIRELDLVGYMEAKGKQRTISFDACERFYGKNTCMLDPLINIPDATNDPNNLMTTIIKRYAQASHERKKQADEFNSLMQTIKGNIDELVVDANTANDMIPWITDEVQHIWNSKMLASRYLSDKAKSLGLSLNIRTKQYENKKISEHA
ncbi:MULTISPECIES: ATP-binding protein [unclassified Sphingobacterium]|uniref:ATP-binding protein n=1 Tax=unclassified Sphingobacterium TaxID=2609468 RepID=UPI0025D2F8EC|nr:MULTISPECIES: ATP-binding protein [unclassified Sphingobacterium]